MKQKREEKRRSGGNPMENGEFHCAAFIRSSALRHGKNGSTRNLSEAQNMPTPIPCDWEMHGNRGLWVPSRDAHQLSVNVIKRNRRS